MYVKEKIKSRKYKLHISVIIIYIVIFVLAALCSLKNENSLSVYFFTINNKWLYYIPITALYLCIISYYTDFELERDNIYRFRSKKNMIEKNMNIILIITMLFIFFIDISSFIIIQIINGFYIDLNSIIILMSLILSQILMTYIYALMNVFIEFFFEKYNKIIAGLLNGLIILFSINFGNIVAIDRHYITYMIIGILIIIFIRDIIISKIKYDIL